MQVRSSLGPGRHIFLSPRTIKSPVDTSKSSEYIEFIHIQPSQSPLETGSSRF